MTGSQRLEMRATGRAPSEFPVEMVETLVRRPVTGDATRIAVGHLAQATLAATAVGLASFTRQMPVWSAGPLIGVAVFAADATLARALGLGASPWNWPRDVLAIDLLHKTSLGIAAAVVTRRHRAGAPM